MSQCCRPVRRDAVPSISVSVIGGAMGPDGQIVSLEFEVFGEVQGKDDLCAKFLKLHLRRLTDLNTIVNFKK